MELLFIASVILAFVMAFAIGSQDVANALGTSVGSNALTLRQSIIVGSICEFIGSLSGSEVSNTISHGFIGPDDIDSNLYAQIMFCTLLGSIICLLVATAFSLTISTTHSLVGSILGLVYISGHIHELHGNLLIAIMLSWVTSPLLGLAISYLLYYVIDKFIISHPHSLSLQKANIYFPTFCSLTISIIFLFLCLNSPLLNLSLTYSLFFAFLLFFFFYIIFIIFPLSLISSSVIPLFSISPLNLSSSEAYFLPLMILTAMSVAFAHGSNDVSNAIAPLTSIFSLLSPSSDASATPLWVLALGGFGIITGLALYGYRIIEVIGKQITTLSYSKGFAVQLGCACTVLLASTVGLSVSTTHCLIGSLIGVSLVESPISSLSSVTVMSDDHLITPPTKSPSDNLNYSMIKKIFYSWILTMPFSALYFFLNISYHYRMSIILYYILTTIFGDDWINIEISSQLSQ